MTSPRGIRNNNPGNMDFVLGSPWKGEIRPSADPRFAQFDTMQDGMRALYLELIAYHNKHNCNTIRQFINRWAPPIENNTSAYVTAVAEFCGVTPDAIFPVTQEDMLRLGLAIVEHENGDNGGIPWVSDATASAALADAIASE